VTASSVDAVAVGSSVTPAGRNRDSRLVGRVATRAVLTAVACGAAVAGDRRPKRPVVHQPRQTRMVYSAAAIEAAEKNARLLIDDPRWKATTVYEFAND
jgi:hypothetical protein